MSGPYLIVAGSVRPGLRRSPAIAAWVTSLAREVSQRRFELVDLAELGLTLDDEPALPAKGVYAEAATRRWSERVTGAAGVVFVTPQYNWGYPASLKNAIDHLYREWRGKPALIVSYGGHGGDKCAAQLTQVLQGLDCRLTGVSPGLRVTRAQIEADDGAIDPEHDFADQRDVVTAALLALTTLAETAASG